jgi:hypothetical protein
MDVANALHALKPYPHDVIQTIPPKNPFFAKRLGAHVLSIVEPHIPDQVPIMNL